MESESSDAGNDTELVRLRKLLEEYGFEEDNLSKEEMIDLLRALQESKTSAKEDELLNEKSNESPVNSAESSPKRRLHRKYLTVPDRRLPWCLLPSGLSRDHRARSLSAYLKLVNINRHREARRSINYMPWPAPISVSEGHARVQPLRATRSGRAAPTYADLDDDSDIEFTVKRSRKRKISSSEVSTSDQVGIYSNKVLSLKRKIMVTDSSPKSDKEIKLDFAGGDSEECVKDKKSAKVIDMTVDDWES